MRHADDCRHDMAVETVGDDEFARCQKLESGHRLGPSTLVLASLLLTDVVDAWSVGELPVDLVVCKVAELATKGD